MVWDKIDAVLAKYQYRHEALISIMQDVQHLENYLSQKTLRYISGKLEIPLSSVFHIATFYKSFSLKPRGRHIIKVCQGTACHLSGAGQTVEEIKRILSIQEGEATRDLNFSLETVNCLGTCALAPVTTIDEEYYGGLTPGKVAKVLSRYGQEKEPGTDG